MTLTLCTRRGVLLAGFGVAADRALGQSGSPSPAGDIVAWGDSMTAGRYPALAAAMFQPPRTVINRGVGGQGSVSIAIRQGGLPLKLTLAGDSIPAGGR